ncbi:NEL-type E3 ubiquitin ligase domain-containing protein [Pseudomonas sp. NPDC088885]|uniref:NEL-type E3 ubiquitin ligase domain-containing protein n=1 Tax=Pseudomonas sp. NPDC088885 TaxID=3364457 RepID=UPI003814287C
MSKLHLSNKNILPALPDSLNDNAAFSFMAGKVPDWLLNTTAQQRDALSRSIGPDMPWFHLASVTQRKEMQRVLEASWLARQAVDRIFERLTPVEVFAGSLLTAALKDRYDITVDVHSTCLRLYRSTGMTGGFEVRTLSLIEGCLHNFELQETRPGYYDKSSDFITRPTASGQFDIVPIKSVISVEAFATLCRELDIGAAYQTYLDNFFDLANPVARAWLEQKIQANEKSAMRVSSDLALMKHDIDQDTHCLLLRLVAAERPLIWKRKTVLCHTLTMLGVELTGIVLFCGDLERSSAVVPLIAYVPHDPDHPLKQYASSAQFVAELTRQLRAPEYQQFFSRFVPHQHRGQFFFQLNNRLSKLQWHAPVPFQQLPAWRPEPVANPDLRIGYARVNGDFWNNQFQRQLNALFADARTRAVPTGDEDAKSRWARLDSFLKVALTVLEVGAFVAAPFVPGLGELMLAYTAYQMLDGTFEGIIEWSHGKLVDAFDHLVGVVESLIQLGALVAGGQLVGALLPSKASPLIERMKVVEMADGRSLLWDSDLQRYSQSLRLDDSARPNAAGIYRHADQDVLPLEGRHFVVRTEPGSDDYRIQHPQRSDAYAPRLSHNGVGAWVHEAERPQAWQGRQLMHRLGHRVDSFSEQSLEQIRVVSGVEEDALRKLHVEHEQPPAMLAATIKRFAADQTIDTFIARLGSDDLQVNGMADVQMQLELLTGHQKWPKNLALRWLDEQGDMLWQSSSQPEIKYIDLTRGQGIESDLFATLLSRLCEEDIKALLDEEFGLGIVALNVRAARLRSMIVDWAKAQRPALVDARAALQEIPSGGISVESQLLRNEFARLPGDLLDELLVDVLPAEKQLAREQGRLSLRLKEAAREAMREWRTARAWEGLYLPQNANIDTYRLALHNLEKLPGWLPEIRLEIRNQSFDGPLIDSVGPQSTPLRKVLVRSVQNTFQPYDAQGSHLQSTGDFYKAVLQALPDAERRSLSLEMGDGQQLHSLLQQNSITRAELRDLLDDTPARIAIGKPMTQGYAPVNEPLLGTGGEMSLEDRFKSLYPQATSDTFSEFVRRSGRPQDASRLIQTRELAFKKLQKTLDDWVAIERGELLPMDQRFHKRRFAKALKHCWQAAEAPGTDGYTLDLDFHWTSDFLEYLPKLDVEFPHVSALQFRHVELRNDISRFLGYFPELRTLDLSENALTSLPRLEGNLRALETLDLGKNQLTLTAENVVELNRMSRLQTLRLGGNPALTQVPDISAMVELQVLDLHDTGITEWPAGLFTLPRPRAFDLDLQGNAIEQVPQVAAGSEQARLIARTRLSRDRLSDAGREQFQTYMRSVGYDPARSYPPKGEQTSVHWLEGVTEEARQSKQIQWDELEREPDSQGFFEVLEKVAESADYVEDVSRPGLTERVWRMLDAATQNTPLREELFRMASNPESCADAGAQIFNEMGIKVLVHEAWMAGSPEQVEASLVRLAKGKARLDQVNEIARANIQARLEAGETFIALDEDGELTGSIDEVEVYLAFQTGLADRLELPWQSRGMLFRSIADVSEAQIDEAYQKVLSLEAGDGLIDRMIEQKFWRKYLKGRHAQAFEQNARHYNAKAEALLDRHLAGSVSQREYEQELVGLVEQRKALLKTLTRDVLVKG